MAQTPAAANIPPRHGRFGVCFQETSRERVYTGPRTTLRAEGLEERAARAGVFWASPPLALCDAKHEKGGNGARRALAGRLMNATTLPQRRTYEHRT